MTSTPNAAPSDTTLSTSALSGMTSEPVMRNSSTNVPSTTRPTAYGALDTMLERKSRWPAAWPVT